jgi:hypothetical protein
MATPKPEVVRFRVPEVIDAKFQRVYLGLGVCGVHELDGRCIGVCRHRILPELNMATPKPKVIRSRVLEVIDGKFQRLYLGLRGPRTRRTQYRLVPTSIFTGIERGGSLAGSYYISSSGSDRREIPKALPRFAGSTNSTEAISACADSYSYRKGTWRLTNQNLLHYEFLK